MVTFLHGSAGGAVTAAVNEATFPVWVELWWKWRQHVLRVSTTGGGGGGGGQESGVHTPPGVGGI